MSIIKSITSINITSIGSQKVLTSLDNGSLSKLNYTHNQTSCGCSDFRSGGNLNIINIDIDISGGRRCC